MSDKKLKELISHAVHELKAPIRHSKFFSQLIIEDHGKSLPEEVGEQLEKILQSQDVLEKLINDIREYIKAMKCELTKDEFTLSEIVRKVLGKLENTRKNGNIEISIDQEWIVSADEHGIEMVFHHIVDNAQKYFSPERNFNFQISGNYVEEENVYEISFQDNGIGFDEKYRDKIFEPFTRLIDKNKYQSSGLGLAIASEVIKKHKGSISVTSKLGEGSQFVVRLPKNSD